MNSVFLTILVSIASAQAGQSSLLDSTLRFNQLKGVIKFKTMFALDANGTEVQCVNSGIVFNCEDKANKFLATHSKIFARTSEVLCMFKLFNRTVLGASASELVHHSTTLEWCLDIKQETFHIKPAVRH